MVERRFIIYGAGKWGKSYFDILSSLGKSDYVYGFCDKAYQELASIGKKKISSYEDVKDLGLPFFIGLSEKYKNEVEAMLEADGQTVLSLDGLANYIELDIVELKREYTLKFHILEMDGYFASAESEESLRVFWEKDSPFFRMFQKLDLSHVIELACGKGRHVSQYLNRSGDITLVDILQQNIDFCRRRFADQGNIFYYCNNGYNLEKLESNHYSALFSYDAVVHFEMIDIFSYLKDINRVLCAGGLALIHHSNNDGDYKAAFDNAIGGRSFMNQKLFAYLAYRAGFEVIEQQVIDWNKKDWDCISLIKKPLV